MTEKKPTHEVPVPVQGMPMMYYPPEDEIDLADLWRVLVRRRRVLLTVLVLIVSASLAYALLTPKQYAYRASVEIGSVPEQEGVRLIEDPNTALAKVREGYLPKVVAEFLQHNPEYEHRLKLEARIPKKSQLLVIEGKAPEKDQKVYLGLIQQVVDLLVQDHRRVIDIVRARMESELEAARAKVQSLRDQKANLETTLKRMDDEDKLLAAEIRQLERRLEEARRRYQRMARLKDPASAMTMLMILNQIQADDKRLQQLRERLQVAQKNRRDELRKRIADTERAIGVQRLKVREIENRIENLRQTRAIVPPMRSAEPVGLAKRVIVVLGVILGLVAGVLAAFFAEFLAKVNQEAGQETG